MLHKRVVLLKDRRRVRGGVDKKPGRKVSYKGF